MNSIQPAVTELERAFVAFAPLFHREMALPVITIQSKGRKQATGWFVGQKWGNSDPVRLPEINLSAEHLARPPQDIAETLIHEMVHYANHLDGIGDCTIRQYHNLNFKNRAEEVGLVVERHSSRGWATTKLSNDLLLKVNAINIDPDAFSLFRTAPEKKVIGTRLKKWSCGCTHCWSKTPIDVKCLRCCKELKAVGG